MRFLKPLLGLGAVAGMVAGCATAEPLPQGRIDRDVIYTPAGWPEALRADIHHPVSRRGAGAPLSDARVSGTSQQPATHPAVLLIHGGGWAPPDRRTQMESIARRLAAHGYLVMNATYRLAPQHLHPAALVDLRQALSWLQGNADRLGIDPRRVAAFGYSAGGHLAALLGATQTAGQPSVAVVVGGGTPTDLAKWANGKLVVQYLGGRLDQMPDKYAEASPIRHVSAKHPPTFLYHGTLDWVVPIDHATDYKAALDQAGVPNELYRMSALGHVAAFLFDGGAVDAAIRFMDRHLGATAVQASGL